MSKDSHSTNNQIVSKLPQQFLQKFTIVIIMFILINGAANNPVSAEVLDEHISSPRDNSTNLEDPIQLRSHEKVVSEDIASSINQDSFISTWDTTLSGSTPSDTITLPLISWGIYDFVVDWGDNTSDTITTTSASHSYSNSGIYTVNITGLIKGWNFSYSGGDTKKIIEISQWGNLSLGNDGEYFWDASNLVLTATDAPDLSETTTLESTFRGCTSLGNGGSMDSWNTTGITNMKNMFYQASSFDQPIGSWDTSSVVSMAYMFLDASSFNQSLDTWNTSNVIYMQYMFRLANSFNQPLASWDTSKVIHMTNMFDDAIYFNQPLGSWNVSSVTRMDNFIDSYVFSSRNYDNILNGWGSLPYLQFGIILTMTPEYSTKGQPGRWNLVNNFGWQINDGGLVAPPPSEPMNIHAFTADNGVNLTWEYPEEDYGYPVEHFHVYRGISAGEYTVAFISNTTQFIDTDVETGITYYYAVSAINDLGESPISVEVEITAQLSSETSVPSSPVNVTITAGTEFILLEWEAPNDDGGSPVVEYYIFRGSSSGQYDIILISDTTSVNDTYTYSGITYYYVVAAVNGIGSSPPSTEVSAVATSRAPSVELLASDTTFLTNTIVEFNISTSRFSYLDSVLMAWNGNDFQQLDYPYHVAMPETPGQYTLHIYANTTTGSEISLNFQFDVVVQDQPSDTTDPSESGDTTHSTDTLSTSSNSDNGRETSSENGLLNIGGISFVVLTLIGIVIRKFSKEY